MDRLYIDVETIPVTDTAKADYLVRNVKVNPRFVDEEVIAKAKREKAETTIRDTALHPLWGEIFAASWAWNDDAVHTVVSGEYEYELLTDLWKQIDETRPGYRNRAVTWCGFNVAFDLRFLRIRSLICGTKPSVHVPVNEPSWSQAYIDAQELIGGRDIKYVSLDDACMAFSLELKPVSIPELWKAWEEDDIDAIKAYSHHDVTVTRELIRILEPQSRLDLMQEDS